MVTTSDGNGGSSNRSSATTASLTTFDSSKAVSSSCRTKFKKGEQISHPPPIPECIETTLPPGRIKHQCKMKQDKVSAGLMTPKQLAENDPEAVKVACYDLPPHRQLVCVIESFCVCFFAILCFPCRSAA